MARNSVLNVGSAGLVLDTKPQLLPPGFWSDGRNVRFDKNRAYAMPGVQMAREGLTDNFSLGLAIASLARYIVFTNAGAINVYDGTTQTDISGGLSPFSDTADAPFEFQMYNGYLLANNNLGLPFTWDPTSIGNNITALVNWDSAHIAHTLRTFGPFLIALGVSKSGLFFPHMMKWSNPAEPGALPDSWDITDATREAGEFSFPDTDKGEMVNGLQMGDRFYVYKRNAIWAVDYVGGVDILGRSQINDEIGLEYRRTLCNVPHPGGNVQFFVGQDSFYIMDGIRVSPLFQEIFQREFSRLVESQYQHRSFAVLNKVKNELWFCFPERGSEFCTLAFCWSYLNNTYSLKDLSGTTAIVSGLSITDESESVVQPISFSDDTFFSDGSGFANEELVYAQPTIVETSPELGKVFFGEIGTRNYIDDPQVCYLERVALSAIGSKPGEEQDYRTRKLITAIVPKLYDGSLQVEIGIQEYEQQPITWTEPYVINPTTYRFDLPEPVSGKFVSFRFSCLHGEPFEFAGFDYELDLLGEF